MFTTHIAGARVADCPDRVRAVTERIRLGTGVVPIYTRTPATMAQTAATIDVLSGGRLPLGLGVSHRPVVEGWHGQTIDRPAAEMREYVGSYARSCGRDRRRAISGTPASACRVWSPPRTAHLRRRPVAGMLRLAGEIADGVILWLCNPNYIRDVVVPEVRAGRERAGHRSTGCVVAAVPSAVTDDPAGVRGDALDC